ncbi:SDR family NAD(P)-dependent oxidoreductase [Priestia megaterium]|uniref:SDR family NAD(P)-dependent oxidoreductase n=1 Tax=Priestia megaterium TaxID=1404 RepID=UPI0023DB42B5|nr:SDR family oxidoreductase [Priestia megaterium]MDF2014698.1 SDR family oxidoreductase [Priestia megaterium]
MSNPFEGQVALVTGAGGGMGLASAKAFAQAGASVALVDINEKNIKEEAKKLVQKGFKAIAIQCDVSKEDQVKSMVEKTVEAFGRLDAAYNNSGVINNLAIDTADFTVEEYDHIMNTNLRGVWLCMKYELQQMQKQGNGTIVNCSSIAGITGAAGRAIYSATKHGVLGITKSAAIEYASKGIRINAVCPGTIETPMVEEMVDIGDLSKEKSLENAPIGRLGRSDEIAEAVIWLCSPAASYIVGQSIAVDGGVTMK